MADTEENNLKEVEQEEDDDDEQEQVWFISCTSQRRK